jgi:hypothetical protein
LGCTRDVGRLTRIDGLLFREASGVRRVYRRFGTREGPTDKRKPSVRAKAVLKPPHSKRWREWLGDFETHSGAHRSPQKIPLEHLHEIVDGQHQFAPLVRRAFH